jgi:hypothetical protein
MLHTRLLFNLRANGLMCHFTEHWRLIEDIALRFERRLRATVLAPPGAGRVA